MKTSNQHADGDGGEYLTPNVKITDFSESRTGGSEARRGKEGWPVHAVMPGAPEVPRRVLNIGSEPPLGREVSCSQQDSTPGGAGSFLLLAERH